MKSKNPDGIGIFLYEELKWGWWYSTCRQVFLDGYYHPRLLFRRLEGDWNFCLRDRRVELLAKHPSAIIEPSVILGLLRGGGELDQEDFLGRGWRRRGERLDSFRHPLGIARIDDDPDRIIFGGCTRGAQSQDDENDQLLHF